MERWRISEHGGASGLEELESAWRALTAAMPSGRAHHSWEAARAYQAHLLAPGETLRYLALWDDARLRAVCPLRDGADHVLGVPVRVLSAPWGGEWPFGDPVCPEDDARAELLPEIAEYLRHAPGARPVVALGPADAASRLWEGAVVAGDHLVYDDGACNHVECTGDFDAYFSALSKNFRGNLRKARNKLAKVEGVRMMSVTDPAGVGRELEQFIRLEGAGWKGSAKGGEAIALRPENVAFYRDLFAGLATAGRSEINALYVKDRCIASQLCVRSGDVYEMYKIAFDAQYAPQAPGQMLFEHTLRRCFADPELATVDLMSDTPWHHDWRPVRAPMSRAYISLGGLEAGALMPLVRLRFGPVRRLVRSRSGTGADRQQAGG